MSQNETVLDITLNNCFPKVILKIRNDIQFLKVFAFR